MIDRGLLATLAIIVGVITLLDRRLRRRGEAKEPILSMASGPLMAGLAAARLAAVALDDPGTLRRPLDLLLIRGGMEFWAGAAGAAAMLWLVCRREQASSQQRLAELTPFALWAYAAYEATCVVRDGCFGPSSPLGLRPGGLGAPQFPTGLLVGVAVAGAAALLWRGLGRMSATTVVVAGAAAVAGARSLSGFVLPKVTAGLTRPHRESLALLTAAALVGAGITVRRSYGAPRHRRSRAAPGVVGSDGGASTAPEEFPSHRLPAMPPMKGSAPTVCGTSAVGAWAGTEGPDGRRRTASRALIKGQEGVTLGPRLLLHLALSLLVGVPLVVAVARMIQR